MHFFRQDQPAILQIAAQATGSTGWGPDAHGILAVPVEDSPPVAVGVFERFTGRDADFHFAMLHSARFSRDIMQAFVMIAFHPRAMALERVWGIIPTWNLGAQAMALRLGFQFEHRKRAGLIGGGDAIVLSLTPQGHAPARLHRDED
jgi:RimJ/RimL family protein N-acetyltransferase